MNKKQIISLWIFAFLWAITLAIWYIIADSSYNPSWGFTEFVQASVFWGVFAI